MTTLETLKAARELIASPKTWCQRTAAMRKDASTACFVPCAPSDLLACKFCAIGALQRIVPWRPGQYSALDILGLAAARLYSSSATQVNDIQGHADVLMMYDHAIAAVESETYL